VGVKKDPFDVLNISGRSIHSFGLRENVSDGSFMHHNVLLHLMYSKTVSFGKGFCT
jgi:hypothetical protein